MKITKDQVLNIIKSNEWDTQGFNAYPLYIMCASAESGWLVKEYFGAGYTHFIYFFSNGRAYMYYDKNDWVNICNGYYDKVKTQDQLEKLISKYRADYQDLVKETVYDEKELKTLSTKELITLLKKLCNRLVNAVGFAHGIEGITYGSEKMLRELLGNAGSFNEQEFSLICSPIHNSFLFDAQKELRRIKSLVSNEQSETIDRFIIDYGWIENTYIGRKQFSHSDIIHRIEGLKDDSGTDAKEILTSKKDVLERLKLSEQDLFIISTIELCFHWQDERKKYILQSIGALEPALEKVAKKLDIDATDLKFANPNEICESKLTDTTFHIQLKERRKKSVCYSIPDKYYNFTGSDYDFLSENLHIEFAEDTKEIKGTVASPGITQGIVRVCESVSDIDKIQLGEILVASMTRPEYLPAMQRAIAFITDEGGVTCHAAIVAREMKKPCIIGTKIATKILKDGDLVEVDAENGVVKIIKK